MPQRHARPCTWPRCPHRQPCPVHHPAEQADRDRRRQHYRGSYQRRARQVRAAANADPTTRCRRCRRTLAEILRHHPHAIWTAGHVIDGQVDGDLEAECSPCNYSAGGRGTTPPDRSTT